MSEINEKSGKKYFGGKRYTGPIIALTETEWQYIRENALTKSDKEIADKLKRSIKTIRNARKKIGIIKKQKGKIKGAFLRKGTMSSEMPNRSLTEEERKEFFVGQLQNSLYYENLKNQFTKEEIDFYLEEWGGLCVQFEDIIATEKRQIDEYIVQQIMGNRIKRNIQITEEIILQLQKEILELRKNFDVTKDEEAQARDQQLMFFVNTMSRQSSAMTNDYQKNVDTKNKILSELNARRRDRIESIKKAGTTFAGLVQAFRDRAVRESQGKYAELVRIAKEQKLREWRKVNTYPDGSKDNIIFDDQSEIPKNVQNYLENPICYTIDRFKKEKDKNILIVENDNIRIQWFQDHLSGNKIEIASSFYKAYEKLCTTKYDLICLDYDIGLDLKGDALAQSIIDNKFSPNADILIHSMNKRGAENICKILSDTHNVEVYSFETLLEAYKNR